jgi:exopolyphosphatase/guanosine-5'-triphosphate,3'-diphosphate pyrophosphatase
MELGRRYEIDFAHARHVADLSTRLFRQLQALHRLPGRYELILHLAALLHEVGLFVSSRSYHKHTLYLLRNSELFGLSQQDMGLVALVARYHRRSSPMPSHEGYWGLSRERRTAVSKLAAMMRVALALDESRSQRISSIECERRAGRLVLATPDADDLSLEQMALKHNVALFEETFGMQVFLRRSVKDVLAPGGYE